MKTLFYNFIKYLSLIFIGSIFSFEAFSQIATNYIFSQTSGTFVPITGGTKLIDGTSSTSLDSWTSPVINIPTLNVDGVNYTTAYMTSNGVVKLGGNAPSTTMHTGISTNPDGGGVHLCPFSADLNKALSTTASEMRWQEVGNEVVFQWKGWCRYGQTENFDLQVRVNKLNGVIKFVYNLNSGPGSGVSYQPQVGISTANTANNYLNRLVNTANPNNWYNSNPGTANDNACRFTGSTTDPRSFVSGQQYIFSPTPCSMPNPGATIASLTNNICVGSAINFSLTNPTTGSVVNYQWQSSNDNINFNNIAGATNSSAALSATYLYYRCRVICLASNDTVYSTPVTLNYMNNINSVTDAQRCGPGTLDLSATANTGATISWFETESGGTSIGNGTTFTTPFISTSANYYAQAQSLLQGFSTTSIGAGASTGTGVSYNITQGTYGGLKGQYIITATELTALGLSAGNITSVGFDLTAVGATLNGFNIQIGNTSLSEFGTPVTIQTLTNTVYSAASFVPVVGVNNFVFNSPFYWDGVSNIIISFSWSNNNSSNATSTIKYDNHTNNMSLTYRRDNETAANMFALTGVPSGGSLGRSTNRPKFILNQSPIVCTSPRKIVTATVNSAPTFTITDNKTVCNNAITTLSVTSTQTSFNQVTWSPITHLFTDAAATIPYVANTHAYTVYFKSAVVGSESFIATALNTTTQCGGIDTVTLQVLPANATAIATPGVLCVSGSSILKITPAITQTGELYQWQSSLDNSTFTDIGTSNSFDTLNTGNLTSTHYYRAIVKNSDGTSCFNSVSDTVFVNSPTITSTTPGTRCGLGTVTLGATSPAGTTLKWYTTPTGGAAIGTGTSFTTPIINTTTNFYVGSNAGTSAGIAQLGAGAYTSNANSPTYSGTSPYAYHYGNYKHQMLVTAAELSALGITAGNITSLGFDVVTAGTPIANFNNFNISLIPTTLTALTATFETGGTNVFSATSVTPSVGINTYNFTTPFVWDGTSNIIVQTCYNNNNNGVVASSAEVRYDSTAFMSHNIYRVDNTQNAICNATAGNSSNDGPITKARPKMIFGYVAGCESVRQLVVATVTPAPAFAITNDKTVCNNAITTLTVTTGSSNYDSITWSPASNLYTNAAATTAYVAGTHATILYYKSSTVGEITYTVNASNTSTHCANIDTVRIQVLPASITAIAQTSELCESGSTTISYNPAISQTGFTQQWSSSTDNITYTDIAGATGNTYTTPTLTSTNYFKVTIKNSDGAVCMSSFDTVRVLHPAITNVVNAERCGPGSVNLNVTAVDGIAYWYPNATGGSSVNVGNAYTTPNINANTTYYVSSLSGSKDTFTVGTGTTTSSGFPNPYNKAWGGNRHQYLIPAAELTAAGLTAGPINGLALDIVALSTTGTVAQRTMNDFTIRIANSNNANLSGGFVTTGLQTVYNTAGYIPSSTGWNYIQFNNNYQWDGISGIVVEFTSNSNNGGSGGAHTIRMSTTSYVATYYRYADNLSPATSAAMWNATTGTTNSTSTRANIRFFNNTLCESVRTPVTATIKAVPTADLTPNGNVSICDGHPVTLTTTGVGTYTWLRNNNAMAGQTSNTLVVSQADAYKVVVTGANNCTDTSVVANVSIAPNPIINLGNDTTICDNVPFTLSAGNPGATYLWNDNSTAGTLDITTPGTYSVTVTNSFNCVAADTITIGNHASPIVDLGNDTAICPSVPIILDADNTGANYSWSTGATSQTISVNQAGTYAVSVTDINGCIGTDEIEISLIPEVVNLGFNFEPLFNQQAGLVRFTPIHIDPNFTYEWSFGDGNTSNLMIAENVYQNNGTYDVSLKVSDGCSESIEILTIYVDRFTSVTSVGKNNIAMKVYPNPASNKLNIEVEGENVHIKNISVYNALGQQVLYLNSIAPHTINQSLMINNFASGAYIIKVETNKGTLNRKFDIIK